MPLRLNVGVSKKLGLPEYSSIGASCNLELEVDPMLIHNDLDGLHEQIRGAFVAVQQAVNDELARLQAQVQTTPSLVSQALPSSGNGHRNGSEVHHEGSTTRSNGTSARANGTGRRPPKAATANQVRAIVTIARRQHADLEGLLRDEYGVERPEDLSLADASRFIDQLKAASGV
jgi:hypothetical protein